MAMKCNQIHKNRMYNVLHQSNISLEGVECHQNHKPRHESSIYDQRRKPSMTISPLLTSSCHIVIFACYFFLKFPSPFQQIQYFQVHGSCQSAATQIVRRTHSFPIPVFRFNCTVIESRYLSFSSITNLSLPTTS